MAEAAPHREWVVKTCFVLVDAAGGHDREPGLTTLMNEHSVGAFMVALQMPPPGLFLQRFDTMS